MAAERSGDPEAWGPRGPRRARLLPRRAWSWVFLAIPTALLVCPPLYNRAEPAILGVPFFYAYQVLAVPLAAGCMVVAHRVDRGRR